MQTNAQIVQSKTCRACRIVVTALLGC